MKITVHNPNQIGGCITEIESESGTRIIIDTGSNLPGCESKVEADVAEITRGCDAVLITHYHGDHIGEYMRVPDGVPIYMGEQAKEIFLIWQKTLAESTKIKDVTQENIDRIGNNFNPVNPGVPIRIKDMTITPVRTDHSAFDSYMYLIEAGGRRILHTGDFRTHGAVGKGTPKALNAIVAKDKLDALIIEGTMLSRADETVISEFKLRGKAIPLIKSKKYVFIMCSFTNIDRIAAFYHANKKAGSKLFVCDKFQAEILDYVTTSSASYTDYYNFSDRIIFNTGIWNDMTNKGFCMLVRKNDFSRKFIYHPEFKDNLFIYSQWKGYIDGKHADEETVRIVPKEYEYLHTSGHATAEAITQICDIVKPGVIIPIHGENSHDYDKLNLPYTIKHLENKEIYVVKETE